MSTLVQTVTLDPAFLQEIKEDDVRLKRLLEAFRQLVFGSSLSESDRPNLTALAVDVRDRLAFHFALEEAYGYFEDPVTIAPRLCERIDRLRSEHVELYEEAARIADLLEDPEANASTDLATLQDACSKFLRRVDLHEAAENALIVQAFNEDIGVGD